MTTTATPLQIRPCPIALWRAEHLTHTGRRVAAGDLIRVRRGVYASRTEWDALAPWDRYLVRVHAVAMLDPGVVFSHESAAVLLGLPILGDPVVVHVTVPHSHAAREAGGIRSHRSRTTPEAVTAGGLIVTTPVVTAVTLARHRHNALGLAVADAALRLDATLTSELLTAENEGRATGRGRDHARWPLERARGLAETALESFSVAVIEWLGFPAPELQREFVSADGVIDRGDLWWGFCGLLGEADGELKYDGRFGDPAARLRERHERDRRLRGGEVSAIAHWGWYDVGHVAPVRALLLGHGLPQIAPEDPSQLHTLTRLLAASAPGRRGR